MTSQRGDDVRDAGQPVQVGREVPRLGHTCGVTPVWMREVSPSTSHIGPLVRAVLAMSGHGRSGCARREIARSPPGPRPHPTQLATCHRSSASATSTWPTCRHRRCCGILGLLPESALPSWWQGHSITTAMWQGSPTLPPCHPAAPAGPGRAVWGTPGTAGRPVTCWLSLPLCSSTSSATPPCSPASLSGSSSWAGRGSRSVSRWPATRWPRSSPLRCSGGALTDGDGDGCCW